MQSPMVIEAGDEMLQVLEVCEPVEERKEVIITTIERDSNTNLPSVASSGPSSKPSQVRQGPTGRHANGFPSGCCNLNSMCIVLLVEVVVS